MTNDKSMPPLFTVDARQNFFNSNKKGILIGIICIIGLLLIIYAVVQLKPHKGLTDEEQAAILARIRAESAVKLTEEEQAATLEKIRTESTSTISDEQQANIISKIRQ